MDIAVDISGTVIETERLMLRAWRESDLDDFYEYASVEGVGEMAGWKHHECIEETRLILHAFIAEKVFSPSSISKTTRRSARWDCTRHGLMMMSAMPI